MPGLGSEDTYTAGGISTTVTDDSDDNVLDFDVEDSSPGEDDKIEEELNKSSTTTTPSANSFGSPSSYFTVPNPPSTPSSSFGSPTPQTTQPQSSWNPGSFGIPPQQTTFGNAYTPPQSQSIWSSGNSNGSSWWGSSNNNSNNGSWWGSNNNNSFNAFNNSPTSNWGWGSTNNQQQVKTNINLLNKKLVFCSLADTIVCSFSAFSNGRLTYINRLPVDIPDMYVRKEVLFKMSRIPADAIYIITPSEWARGLVCNTSLSQKRPEDLERDMQSVTDYLRMCVMTFMKHTISNSQYCQFLLTPNMDWRYISSLVSGEINNINQYTNNQYTSDKVVFLGTGGGSYGYGFNDKMVADTVGIEFLDTNILLNC